MSRLALLVEGEGDAAALPNLVSRMALALPDGYYWPYVLSDPPIRVPGGLTGITARRQDQWLRFLGLARKRPNLGAVLAVFDGDHDDIEGRPFCAIEVARTLAERGRAAGAGSVFSLAVVILRQEYESLLIAAAEQLPGLPAETPLPADIEAAPRGAKKWLADVLPDGYKELPHQLELTRAVTDWEPVRRQMRSFRRLESALVQLAAAVATGSHVATPVTPA